MTPPKHKCYAAGCEQLIHQNQLMCRQHWRMVSPEHQQAVWATWKEYREAKIDETRVEAFRLYKFACDRARYDVDDALKRARKAA